MPEPVDPNTFQIPDDLTALSREELATTVEQARAEADTLRETDPADMTDEQVSRIEALAAFVAEVGVEETRREEQAAERQARVEAATAAMNGGDDDGEGDDEGTETDDAPAEGEGDDTEGEEDTSQVEQLAAGGSRIRRTAKARPPVPARKPRQATSLVAAADVSGFSSGATLESFADVARAFSTRSKAFPNGAARSANVRHQLSVATIHRNHENDPDGLYDANPDYADSFSMLVAAASEKRLPGGSLLKSRESRAKSGNSLVAAGGWCAPSETMYDLRQPETLDGIIDLPEVGVSRGGIRYTTGPDWSDIFTSAGFSQTEAQAIAGTTKACVEVDCPDFVEVRLDAVGICVKAPLLTRAAYNELIQRWIEGTVVANQHKVAARLIAGMRTALGTALAPTLTGTPITWSTLTALELVIEGQRTGYRLAENETLEVVVPRWVRVAIRADLANRNGIAAESVTNAQIAQHFADRGAAVQWVLNYLEIASPLTNVAFPATFEVMVYPAGTFVKGTADVISLDTVYDTADLQTNVYTAAFVEDGVLLAKMGPEGKRITLPVNVSGMLGSPQLDDSWGNAQVENAGAAAV